MLNHMINCFETTAIENENKIAVVDGDQSISFGSLRKRCRCIASGIIERFSNTQNKPIAVFLSKSIHIVIADIAVSYSCNIFMNLDINLPADRLKNIIKLIQPFVIITDTQNRPLIEETAGKIPIINIEDDSWAGRDEIHDLDERREASIDTDPFCIINTSGSTGTPKGVVLNHRSFIDFVRWSCETFRLDGSERIGALSPVVFDIYDFELCLMMMKGSTIVLINSGLATFPVKLVQYLQDQHINFVFWVPSIMVNIANMRLLEKLPLPDLKIIWFAGEVFPTKQFNYWRKNIPHAVMANLYGPIEITLDCTYYIADHELNENEPLPIGIPCNNTDILLLDEKDQICQKGETGELCVRGTSLAMGYYNNPEKTAQVFVQNPVQTAYPELIYRTGDLAYYNENGELMFKGRKDSLIKHMGYRIELGEVEHVLINKIKLVQYCCAVYDYSKKQIVLYYEAEDEIPAAVFRKKFLDVFPKYMIPNVYVRMEHLPQNTNGKIDRLYINKLVNG